MKYTVYIFRCLRTGTHFMGVTPNLRDRFEELRRAGGWRCLAHPELLHVEQFDDLQSAQRRLQAVRLRWRCYTAGPGTQAYDRVRAASVPIESSSLC